jgi:osmotically-inducible protein OsmY
MNLLNSRTVATNDVAGAMSIPCTGAAITLQTNTGLQSDIGASGVNLSITVKNGIATLFGTTESATEARLAENLVAQMNGVEQVINLVTFN